MGLESRESNKYEQGMFEHQKKLSGIRTILIILLR